MSEYQYYEFQSIDKPLTESQRKALRSISSRAHITSNSFINHYNYGDLKAYPLELMEKYFDAFLYVANWGTRQLMFKLPANLISVKKVSAYCDENVLELHEKGNQVILEFTSDAEDMLWEEGEGWLSSLISLRSDLIQGDYRSLYLAWLYAMQKGWGDGEEKEPPVPPNLGNLSGPLQSFVEFMRIRKELVEVAAENSVSRDNQPDTEQLKSWISALPEPEKNDLLLQIVQGKGTHLGDELLYRCREETGGRKEGKGKALRTAGYLLQKADAKAEEIARKAAEKRAREEARKQREEAIAREKHLESLSKRKSTTWKKVVEYIKSRNQSRYDEAVQLLVDLRDISVKENKTDTFEDKLQDILDEHYRKTSLMGRMKKAGLID